MSHPWYLDGPLQMFGPKNEVCNNLTLEKIYGKLIPRIRAEGGGGGGGVHGRPCPLPLQATPLLLEAKNAFSSEYRGVVKLYDVFSGHTEKRT